MDEVRDRPREDESTANTRGASSSPSLHERILNSTAKGILGLDTEGKHTFVNPAAAEMLGYAAEELLGQPSHVLWHHTRSDGRPYPKEECQIYAAYRDGAKHQSASEVFWRKNGTSFPVEYTSTPIWEGERLTGAVVTFNDISVRKRMEDALKRSEERYRKIVETTQEGFMELDLSGRILLTNPHVEVMFGYAPGEMIGLTVIEHLLLPEDRDEMRTRLKNRFKGHADVYEQRFTKKSGDPLWLIVSGTPLLDHEGRVVGAFAMMTDITDRKKIEMDLQESRALLNNVMNGTTDAAFVKDANGRYLFFNAAAEKTVGKRAEDVLGKDDYFLFPEAEAKVIMDGDRAVMKGGVTITYEDHLTTASGQASIYLSTKGPLFDSRGNVIGLFGFSRDITEQKRQERVLIRSEALLREAQYLAQVGNWDWNVQANTLYWSQEIYRIFQLPLDQAPLVDAFLAVIHPEDRPMVSQRMQEALDKGRPYDVEFRVSCPDGSERVVQAIGTVEWNAEGQPIRMFGTAQNITERKHMEENAKKLESQLAQSQKMEGIGRLAGGIAHDFNNLLSVIMGYSQFLLEAAPADSPARPDIEEIRKAGERATALTRQLLAFSRKQTLQPMVVDLNHALKDMERLLARVLGEDIEVTFVPGPGLASVRVDPSQWEQVIINLAVNARDAMPKGGRLILETRNVTLDETYIQQHEMVTPGEYVLVTVSDTGCGIAPEIQGKIFEPFFTTKPSGQGTGLGLSTVYGVVKQSNGYIWVYSELGHGTIFKIYLPAVTEGVRNAPPQGAAPAATKGTATVLVVEDEDSVRTLSRRVLERSGYTVLEAKNGREALAVLDQRGGRVDLIMSDVIMPEMGGFELVEMLKARQLKIPVLLVSGYTEAGLERQGKIDPQAHFLHKPFSPELLLQKAHQILSSQSAG